MSERAEGFWWVRRRKQAPGGCVDWAEAQAARPTAIDRIRYAWSVAWVDGEGYLWWPGGGSTDAVSHPDIEWGPYLGKEPGSRSR
jgi:hypothetical protein